MGWYVVFWIQHSVLSHFSRSMYFVISFSFMYVCLSHVCFHRRGRWKTERIHLLEKVEAENRNPDGGSDYTLAWMKVWKEAAKRHTWWQNSQQKIVQMKSEKCETNVQRIGWNKMWNWVWTEKKTSDYIVSFSHSLNCVIRSRNTQNQMTAFSMMLNTRMIQCCSW